MKTSKKNSASSKTQPLPNKSHSPETKNQRSLVFFLFSIITATLLGYLWNLIPIVFFSFLIQWIVSIPAITFQTERFYDLTGSLTYISLTLLSLFVSIDSLFPFSYSSAIPSTRSLILSSLVLLWAFRLGSFLFLRVLADGKDSRFDRVKSQPFTFFTYWTVQGLWVFLTAAPVFIVNTNKSHSELTLQDYVGISLWVVGFLIEATSDYQKSTFRANKKNHNKWISTGLWSVSRHPNYVGEILLWVGVFISAWSEFDLLTEKVAIVSPLFVYALLRYISGVPLLEKSADRKWGEDPAYLKYKKETPVLFPFGSK